MDRGTIIYDIERCTCHVPDACRDCSHYTGTVGFECMEDLLKDALALLKEQEAVKPKKADNPEESKYCCGICGYPLWLDEFYCAHCGRRIEWEGR